MFNIIDKMQRLNANIKLNTGQLNVEFDDTNYTQLQRKITFLNEINATPASTTHSQNYGALKEEKKLQDSCNRNYYNSVKYNSRHISYVDKIEPTKWNHMLEEASKNEDRVVYYDIYKKEKQPFHKKSVISDKEEEEEEEKRNKEKQEELHSLRANQLVNLDAFLERPKYSQLVNLGTRVSKESKTSKGSIKSEQDKETQKNFKHSKKISTNKELYEILRLMENRKMGIKKKGNKKNSEMKVKGEENSIEDPNKQRNNITSNTVQQIRYSDVHSKADQNNLMTIPDTGTLHKSLKDTLVTSDMHNGNNTGISMQKDFFKNEDTYLMENENDRSVTLCSSKTYLTNKGGDVNKRNSFEKNIDIVQEKMHTYVKKQPTRCSVNFNKSMEIGNEVIYKKKEEEGIRLKDGKENDRTHIYNIFRNFGKQKCNNVANAGVRSYLKNQERKNYNCDKKGVRNDTKENVSDNETKQLKTRQPGFLHPQSLSLYKGGVDESVNENRNVNDGDHTKNRTRIATLSDLNDFRYISQNEFKEENELMKIQNIAYSVESMKLNVHKKKNESEENANEHKHHLLSCVESQNVQSKESYLLKKKSMELGTENNPFSICRYASKASSKRYRQHDEKQDIETNKNSNIEENSGRATEIHQMKHWNKKRWNEKCKKETIHIKDISTNKDNTESMSVVTRISGGSFLKTPYKNNNNYNNNNNKYKSLSETNSTPFISTAGRNFKNDLNNIKRVKEAFLKWCTITKPMQKYGGMDNNRKAERAIDVQEKVKKEEKKEVAITEEEEEEEEEEEKEEQKGPNKKAIYANSLLGPNKTAKRKGMEKVKGKNKFSNQSVISQVAPTNSLSSYVSSLVTSPLGSSWSSTTSISSEKKTLLNVSHSTRYDKMAKSEKIEQKRRIERKKNSVGNKHKNNLESEEKNGKEAKMEKETKKEKEKKREGDEKERMEVKRKIVSSDSRKRRSDTRNSITDDCASEQGRKEKKKINKGSKRNKQYHKNNSDHVNQRNNKKVEEYNDTKTHKGEIKENNESYDDDDHNEKESSGEWIVVQSKRRKDKKKIVLDKKMYSNNSSNKKQKSNNKKDLKRDNKMWKSKRAQQKKEKHNIKDNEKKVETNKNNSEINNQENSNTKIAGNSQKKDDVKIAKEKSSNKNIMNYAQRVSFNEVAKNEQIGKKETEIQKENNSCMFKQNGMEREKDKEEEKIKEVKEEDKSNQKTKYVENVNKNKKRKRQAFNNKELSYCENGQVFVKEEEEEENNDEGKGEKEEKEEIQNNDEEKDEDMEEENKDKENIEKEEEKEREKMEQNSNKQNEKKKNNYPNEGASEIITDVSKNENICFCIGEKGSTKDLQNNLLNGKKKEAPSKIFHKVLNKTPNFLEQRKNVKQKEQNEIEEEFVPHVNKNDNSYLQMNYYKMEQPQTIKPVDKKTVNSSDKNPFLKLMNEQVKDTVQSQEEPSTAGNLFSVPSHNQLLNNSMFSNTTIDREYAFKQVPNTPMKYNSTNKTLNTSYDAMTLKTKRYSNERSIGNFIVNNTSKTFHRVNNSQRRNDPIFNLNNVMKTENKINLQNFNVSFDFSNFVKNKKKCVENSVTQEYLNELNKIYFFIKNIQKKYACNEKLRAIFHLLENEVENINIEKLSCFDNQRTLPITAPSTHEEMKGDVFWVLAKEERLQKYEKEGTFQIEQTICNNYKREWNHTGGSNFTTLDEKNSKNYFYNDAGYGKKRFFNLLEKENVINSNLGRNFQKNRFRKNKTSGMWIRYFQAFRKKQKKFEIKNWHFKGRQKMNKKKKQVIKVNNIFALEKNNNSHLLFKTNTNKILKNVNWKNYCLKTKKQTLFYKLMDPGGKGSTEEDQKKIKEIEMKYYDELVSSDDEVTLIYKYNNGSDRPLYSLKKL